MRTPCTGHINHKFASAMRKPTEGGAYTGCSAFSIEYLLPVWAAWLAALGSLLCNNNTGTIERNDFR